MGRHPECQDHEVKAEDEHFLLVRPVEFLLHSQNENSDDTSDNTGDRQNLFYPIVYDLRIRRAREKAANAPKTPASRIRLHLGVIKGAFVINPISVKLCETSEYPANN